MRQLTFRWILPCMILFAGIVGVIKPASASDIEQDQCLLRDGPGDRAWSCLWATHTYGGWVNQVGVRVTASHYAFPLPMVFPADVCDVKFDVWGRRYDGSHVEWTYTAIGCRVGSLEAVFNVDYYAADGSYLCTRSTYDDKPSAPNCIIIRHQRVPGSGGGGSGGTNGDGGNYSLGGGYVAPVTVTISRFAFSNGAGVIFAKDGRDAAWATLNPDGRASAYQVASNRIGAILDGNLFIKDGLHGQWIQMTQGADVKSFQLSNNRIAYINGAGVIFAKDDLYGSWATLNPDGRASALVLNGKWIGAILDGAFHVKDGIHGQWVSMTGGSDVRKISILGNRFAFMSSAGIVFAKDGRDSPWAVLNNGVATDFVLDGQWIGLINNGSFLAKEGIHGHWVAFAEGGDVRKIAIRGNRFAFSNGAGMIFAKDGRDTQWSILNPDGRASDFVLENDWIGAILDGSYYVKDDLHAPWTTLAPGGDVKTIRVNDRQVTYRP